MKGTSEKQFQERFTQSSRSASCIGIPDPLDHRVRREHLWDLSVVSVRSLCDLCEKLLAFLPSSGKFRNDPGSSLGH
jgi:hypothetical protein